MGCIAKIRPLHTGPLRTLPEATDNLKDWGASVMDIGVLDGISGEVISVAGDSAKHLSMDELFEAMSLGFTEAANIPGMIGLVRV